LIFFILLLLLLLAILDQCPVVVVGLLMYTINTVSHVYIHTYILLFERFIEDRSKGLILEISVYIRSILLRRVE
jgi:hypothetical protein